MKQFLGSIEFNKSTKFFFFCLLIFFLLDGDLLISSSSLTYQYWSGSFVAIDKQSLTKNDSNFFSNNFKSFKTVKSGVCTARWVTNDTFLIGTDCGKLELLKWNENFDFQMSKEEHDGLVTCIDRKFNSEKAVSGSSDCRIKIWDLNEALSIRTFRGHDYPITSLTLNPLDVNCMISTSEDGRAVVWDMRKSKPGFNLNHGLKSYPTCSAWSAHDSYRIILGNATGHIGIYDLRNMSLGTVHKVHERLIRQVKINSSKLLSTASDDTTSKVFHSMSDKDLKLL